MTVIWKYTLEVTDRQTIQMPAQAVPLCVQSQGRQLCLWAMVDEDRILRPRTFAIYGTGNPIEGEPGKYIGTVQMGVFVWHVFEVV